jgi:hydrogenase maturation protease
MRAAETGEIAELGAAFATQVVVVGCGNRAAGDDAAGVVLAERIARLRPESVEARPLGTDLLSLHDDFERGKPILITDAVSSGEPPGTIHLLPLPSSLAVARTLAKVSTHGWDLTAVVDLARGLGKELPPLALIGIEAGHVREGDTMSPEVENAIDFIVENFEALTICFAPFGPGDAGVRLHPPGYALPATLRWEV